MPPTTRPRARIAKRRSAATLISYLTPPVAQAGLYRGLLDLKASIERWRGLDPRRRGPSARDLAALIQAQAAAARPRDGRAGLGRDAEGRDRAARRGHAGARIHADPARPARGRRGAPPEERVDLLLSIAEAAHGARPERAAIAALVDGATPEDGARARRADGRRPDPGHAARAGRRPTGLLAEDHEIAGASSRASTAASSARRRAATCCAPRRSCRPGRNLHGFDPFRIPSAFAVQDGARQAARLLARHAGRRPRPARDDRDGAVGHRQPEDRGRADRPGAGADGRRAALRRLWPARRRRADPAGGARPAAHRRGDDAVGHLPRPAAAADQAAGRGRLPGRHRPTSRSSRTSSASTRWPYRASMAAIWRPRRCGSSATPTAPTAPTSTTWSRAAAGTTRTSSPRPITRRKGFAYGRTGQAGAADGAAAAACWPASTSPTRTSTGSSSASPPSTTTSTRSAASAARCSAPGRRACRGLYRRPDPRRRHGAHARRAGGAGDPHPHAQPEMVRGHAQARLRGRAPDRGPRHQHHRLVGDHRPGRALGLPAAHRDLRARRRRCASGWRR